MSKPYYTLHRIDTQSIWPHHAPSAHHQTQTYHPGHGYGDNTTTPLPNPHSGGQSPTPTGHGPGFFPPLLRPANGNAPNMIPKSTYASFSGTSHGAYVQTSDTYKRPNPYSPEYETRVQPQPGRAGSYPYPNPHSPLPLPSYPDELSPIPYLPSPVRSQSKCEPQTDAPRDNLSLNSPLSNTSSLSSVSSAASSPSPSPLPSPSSSSSPTSKTTTSKSISIATLFESKSTSTPPTKQRVQGDVPGAVRNLLLSIKQLQEALTSWSLGKASELEVSDVYVQFGEDLNSAIQAFAYHRIDLRFVSSLFVCARGCAHIVTSLGLARLQRSFVDPERPPNGA
ncbi:hypothetical protein AX16_001091 [Volvariella volvacea WC 439]|nr:hypothetical protein AX16_001091 [Volvariella volvacea WC 439]